MASISQVLITHPPESHTQRAIEPSLLNPLTATTSSHADTASSKTALKALSPANRRPHRVQKRALGKSAVAPQFGQVAID